MWWIGEDDGFHFLDGDSDIQAENSITPFHFRQHFVTDVEERSAGIE